MPLATGVRRPSTPRRFGMTPTSSASSSTPVPIPTGEHRRRRRHAPVRCLLLGQERSGARALGAWCRSESTGGRCRGRCRLYTAAVGQSRRPPCDGPHASRGGADPNAEADGDTPLLFAVEHGSVAVVRLLLDNGADPGVANSAGSRPLEIAEGWTASDVEAELRRRAGAEEGQEIHCSRVQRPGDSDAIVLEVGSIRTGMAEYEHQLGDQDIADLLRRQLDAGRAEN